MSDHPVYELTSDEMGTLLAVFNDLQSEFYLSEVRGEINFQVSAFDLLQIIMLLTIKDQELAEQLVSRTQYVGRVGFNWVEYKITRVSW